MIEISIPCVRCFAWKCELVCGWWGEKQHATGVGGSREKRDAPTLQWALAALHLANSITKVLRWWKYSMVYCFGGSVRMMVAWLRGWRITYSAKTRDNLTYRAQTSSRPTGALPPPTLMYSTANWHSAEFFFSRAEREIKWCEDPVLLHIFPPQRNGRTIAFY